MVNQNDAEFMEAACQARRNRNLRARERRETARQQFAAKLTGEFVGKEVIKIDVIGGGDLSIVFKDGSVLSIQLDGDDTWNAWITVNNVSLHNPR